MATIQKLGGKFRAIGRQEHHSHAIPSLDGQMLNIGQKGYSWKRRDATYSDKIHKNA